MLIGIVVLIGLALIGGLVYLASAGQPSQNMGQRMPDEGRQHIPLTQTPHYAHYPPTSGPHYPAPDPWGVIGVPIPEGRFVHNLEHGGIVLLYKCPTNNCQQLVAQITSLSNDLPRDPKFNEVKFDSSPYTRMDKNFAVLAWNYLHEMNTLDTSYVKRFYEAHVDRGPEVIP